MFNFFKKRKKKRNNEYYSTPTEAFNLLGDVLSRFWGYMVEGEHKAVDLYHDFSIFKSRLDNDNIDIDFEREVYTINFEDKVIHLNAGQCMYLYAAELGSDYRFFRDSEKYFMAIKEDEDYIFTLNRNQCIDIISLITERERSYCDALKKYISTNIIPLINNVDMARYDIKKCKQDIPLNTRQLVEYHKYIANGGYCVDNNEYSRWNQISSAPFVWIKENSIENPLIVTEISAVTAFVLDYICYATMCLATLDMTKLLNYKNEQSGESMKDAIIDTHGIEMWEYIHAAITDLNCAGFREYVYAGIKVK